MIEVPSNAPPVRPDGLQLDEPRRFQEWFWTAQRISWVLFAALILLSLLGFSGSGGPFARSSTPFPGGGGVADFPRIARWESSEEFRITLPPGGGERKLLLGKSFADAFEVTTVRPEPARYEASPGGYSMIYSAAPGETIEVIMFARPRRPGHATYAISVDARPALRLSTFVLP